MDSTEPEQRPSLGPDMSEHELRRWYWLRTELAVFARTLGIGTAGGKVELTARIADVLAGRTPQPPTRLARGTQLAPPLHGTSVVAPGQRCSQDLRNYFVGRIGQGFRFDRHMREIVAAGDVTLDEVVQHWYDTRDEEPGDIAPHFEYNQFTRAWRIKHPHDGREALLSAWWEHRSRPRSS